jgi:hypothetical protein
VIPPETHSGLRPRRFQQEALAQAGHANIGMGFTPSELAEGLC